MFGFPAQSMGVLRSSKKISTVLSMLGLHRNNRPSSEGEKWEVTGMSGSLCFDDAQFVEANLTEIITEQMLDPPLILNIIFLSP